MEKGAAGCLSLPLHYRLTTPGERRTSPAAYPTYFTVARRSGPPRLVVGRRERMWPTARLPLWRSITLGALLLLWIGISWLLVVSRGDPETFLRRTFAGYSRPDAFNALNRAMACFWVVHSCLSLAALSAARSRRPDVLVVLLIGPAMALGLGVLSQRWSDPNWVVFVGVCLMGLLPRTLGG